tara:strand:+ start:621 stop:836 length:216 start_codon:yes stop_codon:yes gene_type:complete
MADEYQDEEEYTMEQHYEQDSDLSVQEIDPAIADRPGRFDRIIEVVLPGKDQQFHIFHHLLKSSTCLATSP